MGELAHRVPIGGILGRLRAGYAALRREVAAEQEAPAESYSFPELVWAHHLRQKEVLEQGLLDGPNEHIYRRRQKPFEAEHGPIVEAFWCRHVASAVALTVKERPRTFRNLWRRDPLLRLHAATAWRTGEELEIARLVHTSTALAIRVSEVLRGTSERIALQLLLTTISDLLAFADTREGERHTKRERDGIVRRTQEELRSIERYYHRAGEKQARIVYFWGMMRGAAVVVLLAPVLGLLLWGAGKFDAEDTATQAIFATYGLGAAGAIVSVMTRMASLSQERFHLDHEVGRKSVRQLGYLRPLIGAVFALVLYFALKGELVHIRPVGDNPSIYFYAAVAFIAGFSERWVKVVLDPEKIAPRGQPREPTRGTRGPTEGS